MQSYAATAQDRACRFNQGAKEEVAQVFVEKSNDKLVELNLPLCSQPISSEPGCHDLDDPYYLYDPYEDERSKADLINVNGEESFISQGRTRTEELSGGRTCRRSCMKQDMTACT